MVGVTVLSFRLKQKHWLRITTSARCVVAFWHDDVCAVPVARLWWNQVYNVVAKGLKSGAEVLKVDADTVYTCAPSSVLCSVCNFTITLIDSSPKTGHYVLARTFQCLLSCWKCWHDAGLFILVNRTLCTWALTCVFYRVWSFAITLICSSLQTGIYLPLVLSRNIVQVSQKNICFH